MLSENVLKYFRINVLLVCFVFLSNYLYSMDSILVKGRFVGNTKYAKVLIKKFDIGTFVIGGTSIQKEEFSIMLPPDIPTGIYRFQYAIAESERYIDLIVNGKEKEIYFQLDVTDERAIPSFKASLENSEWYNYISTTSSQLERISILNQLINAYPISTAEIVHSAKQELEKEKELYKDSFMSFAKRMSGTWAFHMVVNRPYFFVNPEDDPRIQDYQKREHFWEGFNASEPKLINTPLYTEHILNYLRYWMNPNMNFSPEEKTAGFKRAVDVIMQQFSKLDTMRKFAYKYLSLGFKEIGEEEVLQYLDEKYIELASQCFTESEKIEFDARMFGYSAMKAGSIAPNFKLNIVAQSSTYKLSNTISTLHDIESKSIVLVFWSSTCPHCMQVMPIVNEWAAKNTHTKVVAVCLDVDTSYYKESIKKFTNVLHICDFKAWDSEAAKVYFLVATPTFILINKDKQIVGKFSDWNSLLKQYSN